MNRRFQPDTSFGIRFKLASPRLTSRLVGGAVETRPKGEL